MYRFKSTSFRPLLWVFTLGMFLGVAGCDSLDITDPNAPNQNDVSLQSLVSGVEGAMRSDIGIYLRVSGIMSREAYYFEPADPRYTGELYTGPLDPGGFLVTRPWDARYRTISQAMILLERLDELSAAEQAGLKGFVNTIIGYQLLLNLNYMDENGVKLQFSEDVSTPFAAKGAALAEIARYLDDGAQDLSSAGGTFPFTLSSGFAGFNTPATFAQFNRAIRARVALYMNDAATALNALDASFLDETASMNLGVYHAYSTGTGDRLNPMFEEPTSSSVKLRAHPDFKANAEEGDQRYTSKVLDRSDDPALNPSPSAANGLSSALIATVAGGSAAPYPMVRNEELLLLRAEARIAQNDLTGAEADLNTVRAAAGLDPITLDAASAIDQLLNERYYSLFLEGHRWVDLRRFGRLDQLPRDLVGDPPVASTIFRQMPRPQDEVPG